MQNEKQKQEMQNEKWKTLDFMFMKIEKKKYVHSHFMVYLLSRWYFKMASNSILLMDVFLYHSVKLSNFSWQRDFDPYVYFVLDDLSIYSSYKWIDHLKQNIHWNHTRSRMSKNAFDVFVWFTFLTLKLMNCSGKCYFKWYSFHFTATMVTSLLGDRNRNILFAVKK